MQFLANDKTEYSKEYCKHLEKGKDLNLTDQKKIIINYRLDKIRRLIASLERFIFTTFSNCKFFEMEKTFQLPVLHMKLSLYSISFIFREFLNFFAYSIIFKIPALFICCQVDVVFLFSDRTITNEIWSRQSFLFNRRTRMWKGGKKVTPLNWWQLKL